MIVTNGSTFDKNLTNSDAVNLKDKDQQNEDAPKVAETPVKDAAAKPADPVAKDADGAKEKDAAKLSIDTKREQVKAMLEQSAATPQALEGVEEKATGADAPKLEQSSPAMP